MERAKHVIAMSRKCHIRALHHHAHHKIFLRVFLHANNKKNMVKILIFTLCKKFLKFLKQWTFKGLTHLGNLHTYILYKKKNIIHITIIIKMIVRGAYNLNEQLLSCQFESIKLIERYINVTLSNNNPIPQSRDITVKLYINVFFYSEDYTSSYEEVDNA